MNTVSFVFQNSRLIKASILENVKLGKPNASNEDVMKALKAAQCTDIIEKFPDGVDTVIGSKGVYLSGGEAQRIAIARAILKDSPIVILDEATAFADPDNEVKVQAAIRELSNGKTVIMIAHRLSTVANADKIFVLSDGKLAEEGKFDELRERGGLFQLYVEQISKIRLLESIKGGISYDKEIAKTLCAFKERRRGYRKGQYILCFTKYFVYAAGYNALLSCRRADKQQPRSLTHSVLCYRLCNMRRRYSYMHDFTV